jgi:hypothetical protein
MVFHRELAIGFLDFVFGRVLSDPEDLVKITLCHGVPIYAKKPSEPLVDARPGGSLS